MKTISIIGSTGTVGEKALSVARQLNYNVEALVAHKNLDKLKRQDDIFHPKFIGVVDESLYRQAKELFGERLVCGSDALTFSCGLSQTDIVVISVLGLAGIYPLLEGIKNNKKIALSNKESLVAGGFLVKKTLQKNLKTVFGQTEGKKGWIIPLDSEHSAIFQCLKSGKKNEIKKLILTASGGGFYSLNKEELQKITPAQIFHPNWKMGRKITIDSCTMMNKALEIVEAFWLFGCGDIDYIVHKESIIHSMVQYVDGSIIAQLAPPDMELPIRYALTYPDRVASPFNSFELNSSLSIQPKNPLFYAPSLSQYVIKEGGTAGAVFNAANEAAVGLFEKGEIGFLDVVRLVEKCLSMSLAHKIGGLDDIISAHNQTVQRVLKDYKKLL